mgnify:CR=1 FL=1
MRTIWKFEIPVEDHFEVQIPMASQVLTVDVQHGQPCIWALVNPDAERIAYKFVLRGTGHPIEEDLGPYIGTFQLAGGGLIFHLFHAWYK